MTMTRVLKILWQLPQFLLGYIVVLCTEAVHVGYRGDVSIYMVHWRWASVSFGPVILLTNNNPTVQNHEYGHSQQSVIFGPIYLIVVGLVSIIRNIYCRIRGDWSGYFDAWPENDADRRGGVVR